MSRFTKKVAARIILKAVRSDHKSNRSELPLVGMDANVWKALKYAEYVHHLALGLVSNDELLHKQLKASRRKRADLSKKFKALMVAWDGLTEEERFDLVWAADSIT